MFKGITNLNLDSKGRLAMPSRYRDLLREQCEGRLVVTRDVEEPHLMIYPEPTWKEIESQIDALPGNSPALKRIRRLLVGFASDVALDGSGRLMVAPSLRDYAGLDKAVVLVGVGKKFELWDEAAWNASINESDEEVEDLQAALETLAL